MTRRACGCSIRLCLCPTQSQSRFKCDPYSVDLDKHAATRLRDYRPTSICRTSGPYILVRPLGTPNIPFLLRRLGGCWDRTVRALGGHIAAETTKGACGPPKAAPTSANVMPKSRSDQWDGATFRRLVVPQDAAGVDGVCRVVEGRRPPRGFAGKVRKASRFAAEVRGRAAGSRMVRSVAKGAARSLPGRIETNPSARNRAAFPAPQQSTGQRTFPEAFRDRPALSFGRATIHSVPPRYRHACQPMGKPARCPSGSPPEPAGLYRLVRPHRET